jgi:hypothetical protein
MAEAKSRHLNVLPSTGMNNPAGGTYTSPPQFSTFEKGVRVFCNVSGAANTGGVEMLYLCAIPPASSGPPPNPAAAIPLVGISGAAILCVNGCSVFDFYPSAWLPSLGLAPNAAIYGAVGSYLSMVWCVRVVLPAGSMCTMSIDCELLP